jgi:hypothetical protein
MVRPTSSLCVDSSRREARNRQKFKHFFPCPMTKSFVWGICRGCLTNSPKAFSNQWIETEPVAWEIYPNAFVRLSGRKRRDGSHRFSMSGAVECGSSAVAIEAPKVRIANQLAPVDAAFDREMNKLMCAPSFRSLRDAVFAPPDNDFGGPSPRGQVSADARGVKRTY